MRQRKDILEHVMNGAELHGLSVTNRPLVELVETERVLIENHLGVVEYGCDRIRVKVRFGQICIHGQKLALSMMSKEQLIITGVIECINLFRGGIK